MPTTPTLESRLAVRERPSRAHVMHQRWEQLLFLHWRWDAAEIQRTLPPGLFVDMFQGEAWLAIVPFLMRGIRPRFCPPVPGISNFLELNVRTYVHDEQGRPGVWFYSLDCNQPLAVWTARTFFHLPYQHAHMQARESVLKCAGPPALSNVHRPAKSSRGLEHSKTLPRDLNAHMDSWIDYTCHRRSEPSAARFRYRLQPQTHLAEPGSLEFFLAERYLLFSQSPKGIRCGQVHHTPYPLANANLEAHDVKPLLQAGFAHPNRPPDHIIGSPGIDVRVYALTA
ncbi:MAG: YqjF family protein [Prosthecobacter sp.]|uniref:YqjF family protein n=1 Tax=Prosthecobacter sp. TaxID=1965333 RepID=UPI0038FFE095